MKNTLSFKTREMIPRYNHLGLGGRCGIGWRRYQRVLAFEGMGREDAAKTQRGEGKAHTDSQYGEAAVEEPPKRCRNMRRKVWSGHRLE
jgi:hypothetical protein